MNNPLEIHDFLLRTTSEFHEQYCSC